MTTSQSYALRPTGGHVVAIDCPHPSRTSTASYSPEWLSFTYIGAVLLLIGSNRQWLRRLAAFGWTGRMPLSNYMLQIAILNLGFAAWAFDAASTCVSLLGTTSRLTSGATIAFMK